MEYFFLKSSFIFFVTITFFFLLLGVIIILEKTLIDLIVVLTFVEFLNQVNNGNYVESLNGNWNFTFVIMYQL